MSTHPSVDRSRTRARVIALEEAGQTIEAAYGHNAVAMMQGPEVRVGDVIRLPEGDASDLTLNLWDVACLLDAFRQRLEEELHREEADA